jgi:sugar/nucleoside kinase (ribokinase family)
VLRQYSDLAHIVVVTQSAGEALVFVPAKEVLDYLPARSRIGRSLSDRGGKAEIAIPAYSAEPVDLTGAGDVFATAFLVRYHETHNPIEAGRFAHATAACAIEGEGTGSIPTRERLLARLDVS